MCSHTVARWIRNRLAIDRTLSPPSRAVRIASTSFGVSGVRLRRPGCATTSGSDSGSVDDSTSGRRLPCSQAATSLSRRRREFGLVPLPTTTCARPPGATSHSAPGRTRGRSGPRRSGRLEGQGGLHQEAERSGWSRPAMASDPDGTAVDRCCWRSSWSSSWAATSPSGRPTSPACSWSSPVADWRGECSARAGVSKVTKRSRRLGSRSRFGDCLGLTGGPVRGVSRCGDAPSTRVGPAVPGRQGPARRVCNDGFTHDHGHFSPSGSRLRVGA